jgi:hypothetical protein
MAGSRKSAAGVTGRAGFDSHVIWIPMHDHTARSIATAAAFSIAIALGGVVAAQQTAPTMRRQQGGTLEIAPSIASQGHQGAPQSGGGNVREIPVIPPNQQVLTLPQASTDFLGRWGGAIMLTDSSGEANPPREALVSFLFGKRGGQVVLATTVFGNEQSQVLNTSAVSDGPRAVKITIAGLDYSHRPPLRHVEKLRLELAGGNRIKCTKTVDLYLSGSADPAAAAHYEGLLHPLSAAENRYLAEQILRKGVVPRARIEQGNPPPQ